ncbi:MAG TPA: phosphatidylserine/phosphatidylglycerophosphate/cardiolipin synthase family protein [Longimicrobium sp.]|nr:phosphatidylserine/phosphatidylglycerophosphate/cardiolipin synthase family protein [Longimicrobium sp.]
MLRLVRNDARSIHAFAWTVSPARLLASTAMEVALLVWGVVLWSRLLGLFDGPRPRFRAMLRVWFGTTLAKYVPGSVWPLVTAAGMAARIGASPVALPASFVLHAAFTVLGAAAVAAAARAWGIPAGGGPPPVAAAVALPLAVLLVHPAVLNRLVGLAARLARREAPAWRGRWVHGVALLALYATTWAGYGAAFSLFVSSIAPVSRGAWPLLAGVNALAFVAGFVAVFAPGGIGVREAALAGLLLPVFPGGVRVLIAAASRLWLVAAEMVGGVLVLALSGGGAAVAAVHGGPAVRTRRRPLAPPVPAAPAPAPPPGVTRGNQVEVLTDTAAALGRIAAACRGAKDSVWIAQLAFDADCLSAARPDGRGERLVDALLEAAKGRDGAPGAQVRILLNGSILMNTAPALRRHLAEAGADPARVEVRGLDAFPQIMHAKLVVVDGREAFLVGSPFVNGYWDDAAHRASTPGRTREDLAGRPIHDVSARVAGPAVADLAAWFAEVWNGAPAGSTPPLAPPAVDASAPVAGGGCSARVARSIPAGVLPSRGGGEREILDAYLEAIAGARELIYLENQYFSARPIRQALSAALDARPELEVVLVVNQNPDITAYRGWQDRRMAEGGLLEHPRVGVFSLWAAATSPGPGTVELTQLFIHSKTAVIDDAWATLGTANLDGVSLHSYGDDFSAWPGRRLFRGVRNFDLNLVLLDGTAGEPGCGAAGALRRRLWSRHLGVAAGELTSRPDGGWLPVWRAAAAANAARLADGQVPAGHALPYTPAPRPRAQLRALGIDVAAAGIDLRFDPGWVEVLWSPGWLAKVIPEPVRKRLARRRA